LQFTTPTVGEEVKPEESDSVRKYYSSVIWKGVEYKVGDSCYLMPDAFAFPVKEEVPKRDKDKRNVSIEFFPVLCEHT
jgi:hypothetical protein